MTKGLKELIDRLFRNNAFDRAAAISFWLFLSFIPLLALAGFVLGQVVRAHSVDSFINLLFEIVPAFVEPMLREELMRMSKGGATTLAPLAVLSFLWSAAGGVHNLMDALEVTLAAPPRPWWKQRGLSLVWVVASLVLFGVLAGAVALVEWTYVAVGRGAIAVENAMTSTVPKDLAASTRTLHRAVALRDRLPHAPPAWHGVVAALLLLAVATAFVAYFFKHAVTGKEHARKPWPGAATAIASWVVVSWAFGQYVMLLSNYALYYGSLAAVAVLLLWLYLTSLAFLVGGEVVGLTSQRRAS